MTIVQPNRNQDIKRLIAVLSSFLVAYFLMSVFIYLQTVNLKHDLAKQRKALDDLKVENADLKNQFYSLIDVSNLERLAQERGLIQDANPQWASASPL
jgi:cell division protein FtsB